MTGERWAELLEIEGALPPVFRNALALAQLRARGQRLPVVRVGDVVIVPAADFARFYGALPKEGGNASQDAQGRR